MYVYTYTVASNPGSSKVSLDSRLEVNICRYKSAQVHYTSINRFAAATQQESEDDEEIPIPQSLKPATFPLPIPGNNANIQPIYI